MFPERIHGIVINPELNAARKDNTVDNIEQVTATVPAVLDGSIYTSLGSLYAKAPGWPLSFGDRKKAKAYLEQALTINPDGIDPNFFYGDYLFRKGDYAEAARARRD